MQLVEFFINFFENFFDPKKRIFVGYLLAALVVAFLWLVFSKKLPLRQSIRKLFDKKVFLSKSSKADFLVFFINRIFTLFISPLLLTQLVVATFIFNLLLLVDWPDWSFGFMLSKPAIVATFTFTIFMLDDFTKYIVHRWMHKWPALWALHKVHHSAQHLTPITIYRTHPLEGIVFSLRSAVSQGVAISIFFYFFGNSVDLLTVIGVNILVFSFNVAGSNLRHSHIGIQYWGWLEYVLISPAQHQLHHSIAKEHYDKNFGATLALWDWLFGSLHHSIDTDGLVLGIQDKDVSDRQSLYGLYIVPLIQFCSVIVKMIKGVKDIMLKAVKYTRNWRKFLLNKQNTRGKDNAKV